MASSTEKSISSATSIEEVQKPEAPTSRIRRHVIATVVISICLLLGAVGLGIAIWQGLVYNKASGTVVRIVANGNNNSVDGAVRADDPSRESRC
jgi:hypothetical protein